MISNGGGFGIEIDPFGDALQSKDGILVTDRDGEILMKNLVLDRMFSLPKKRPKIRTYQDLLSFVSEKARKPEVILKKGTEILLNRNGIFRKELFMADGKIIDFHTFPMIGADKAIHGRIWYFRDVTEQKRIEDLRNLQSMMMENLEEGVILSRAVDSTIAYTNRNFEKIFGYRRNELLGKHLSILNAPNPKRPPLKIAAEIEKALKRKRRWVGDIENVRKDGTRFWTRAKVVKINHSEYDDVWVAVQRDITEEKLIKEGKALYQALFESCKDPIFLVGYPEYNLVDANKAALRMLDLKSKKLLPLIKIEDLSPQKQPDGELSEDKVRRICGLAVKTGRVSVKSMHMNKAGENIPIKVKITRIKVDNKILLQAQVVLLR